MTTKINGTSGIEFPNSTVQSVAALPLTGGNLTGEVTSTNGMKAQFFEAALGEVGGAAGLIIRNLAPIDDPVQTTIENDVTASMVVAHRGNLVLRSLTANVESRSELSMKDKALSFTEFGEAYRTLIASYNANAGSALQYHVVQNLGNIEIHNKRGPLYMQANSSGGVVLNGGATSWAAWSDERMKADLVPITDALTKTCSLRAVTGRYNTDAVGTSRSFLIAQDVQAVLPEAVDVMDDGMLTLRTTDVVPLLVGAIKELLGRIEALEAKA